MSGGLDMNKSTSTSVGTVRVGSEVFNTVMGQHEIVSMVTDGLSCTDTNSLLRVSKYMRTHVSTSIDPPWWRDYYTDLDWITKLDGSIIKVLAIYVTTGTSVDPSMNPNPNKDGVTSIFVIPISTKFNRWLLGSTMGAPVGGITSGFVDAMIGSVTYDVEVISPGRFMIVPTGRVGNVKTIRITHSIRPESMNGDWRLSLSRSANEMMATNTIRIADMKTDPCNFTTWGLNETTSTHPVSMAPVILSMYINDDTGEIERIDRIT
ncbi:hypothetical protein B0J12DRAFT_747807 [Macrophomina phaseolina]|uniref:Uncharacterized protein n=1 Tax=Macrophomina phaseolina TaxID=35725 RepID=A0ABQ8FS50_9PEZI|nr:hypothetical protein B0J12DRAFT_747807 [Macrophomina phaseolina]